MILYFIRHAQSANNALWERTGGEIGRADDPELSENGKLQADLLATHLANGEEPYVAARGFGAPGYRFTHVYASPMTRALETGVRVARNFDVRLECRKDFHETGGIFLDDEKTGTRIGGCGKLAENSVIGFRMFPSMNYTKTRDGGTARSRSNATTPFEQNGSSTIFFSGTKSQMIASR